MKKAYLLIVLLTAWVGAALWSTGNVHAYLEFKKEFDKKYVKKTSDAPQEKSLAEAVASAKCNVCHVGTSKKKRNAYGQALNKLIDKKDKKNAAKIRHALDDVEKQPSSGQPNGPTFGDLLKQGRLPGGEDATAAK